MSVDAAHVQPLPPPSKHLDGESAVHGKQYKIHVSNRDGYLSRVTCEATFDVPPRDIFDIFTCADNSHLFRDIKGVGKRQVIKQAGAVTEVAVAQLGEIKILWLSRTFTTNLRVIEDLTDPNKLTVEFLLDSSDVLAKFNGKWTLEPSQTNGKATTSALLEQDILPKGVPAAMKHIPILGSLIRGVSVKAVQRILEDIQAAVKKLTDGMPMEELLNPPGKQKEKQAAVGSFAIDASDSGEDEEWEDAAAAPLDGSLQGSPSGGEAAAGGTRAVQVQLEVTGGSSVALKLTPAGAAAAAAGQAAP